MARQGKKTHRGWESESKLLLFVDSMIIYVGNPKKSTKKLDIVFSLCK
jgi:hypothetical protein